MPTDPYPVLEMITPPEPGRDLYSWAAEMEARIRRVLNEGNDPEELHRAQSASKVLNCILLFEARERFHKK